MALQGLASYPGVIQIKKCEFTLTGGVTPCYAEMDILPQDPSGIPLFGSLTMTDGNYGVVLNGCKVDLASSSFSTDGFVWHLKLLDKRWRWQFSEIYGEYNRLDSFGSVLPEYQATNWYLFQQLFQALKEPVYDITQVPNDVPMYVKWDASNNRADLELADLAERLGCVVILNVDGSISVVPDKVGAQLPSGGSIANNSLALLVPEMPDFIRVIGGVTRVQVQLTLEPVGKDVGGKIVPKDSLSYLPQQSQGWGSSDTLFSNITDPAQRKLAMKYIFRAYRIKVQPNNGTILSDNIVVPQGIGSLVDLRLILPLFPEQNTTEFDENGEVKPKKPQIFGEYWKGNLGAPINWPAGTEYTGDFQLDTSTGIVWFPKQVKFWDSNKQWIGAKLVLLTSFPVTSYQNHIINRYTYIQQINGQPTGTGPETVINEQLVMQVTEQTTPGTVPITNTWTDNTQNPSMYLTAQKMIAYARQKYSTDQAQDVTWNGFVPINPDGAITQVQWTVSDTEGCHTRASRSCEVISAVPLNKTKRRREKAKKRSKADDAIAQRKWDTITKSLDPAPYYGPGQGF